MSPRNLLPDRTRMTCRILKWLSLAVVAMIVVTYFAADITAAMTDAIWAGLQPQVRDDVTYTSGKKLMLQSLSAVGYFSLALIALGAARAFGVFQKGVVFAPAAVRAVRFLGIMVFVFAAIQLVLPTLMVLAITYDNGEDKRALTIAINSKELILLMIGAIIMVIGQVLTQATDIAQENEQFI